MAVVSKCSSHISKVKREAQGGNPMCSLFHTLSTFVQVPSKSRFAISLALFCSHPQAADCLLRELVCLIQEISLVGCQIFPFRIPEINNKYSMIFQSVSSLLPSGDPK